MRPLLSILIYSNSWVALCFSTLVAGIAVHYQTNHIVLFFSWSFCSTVAAYQLHRLFRLKQLEHTVRSNRRLLWMKNTYGFQVIWFVINALASSILTLLLPFTTESLLFILLTGIVVGLYALPLNFMKNGIRNLPFMKNILICSSWTLVAVLPLTTANIDIDWKLLTLIFIAVFAQIVPFDIRDAKHDPKTMLTLPQLVGENSAKIVGLLLMITALSMQMTILGFSWFYPITLIIAAFGHLFPFQVGYQLRLEFMWELPLGMMGLWFMQ